MLDFSFLLSIVSQFFMNKADAPLTLTEINNLIKKTILRILFGIILTSVCIYFLILTIDKVNMMIMYYENGIVLSFMFTVICSLITLVSIYFLFKEKKQILKNKQNDFDVSAFLINLYQNFNQGYNESKKNT